MTSNALWPLLIKYENGKIAGKSPVFVPLEKKKCACGGGERKNKREGQRVKLEGSFLRSELERTPGAMRSPDNMH